MPASQVYGKTAENPSRNGSTKDRLPENFPDDPLFRHLANKRKVSYEPLVADAIRYSEAPKRLTDRYTEAATLLFSNLLYWTPKSTHKGWIYKSREEVWRETRLPRRRQDRARELLREAGILQERLRRGRLYYRIRWAGLKPLLRLALEGSGETSSGSPCDPGRSGSPCDPRTLDHHAIQGAGPPGDPASVFDTDSDIQASSSDQSSSGQEPAVSLSGNGSGASKTSPEMDDDENLVGIESKKSRSTTLSFLPETPKSRSGREDAEPSTERKVKPLRQRPGGGFASLPESIIADAVARPADELSQEATTIGRQLCDDLGRPYSADGLAVRLAEECIRRGCPEAVGVVAAKASRDDVRSPDGYLRVYIHGEIQERKDHLEPGGDPVARFQAARNAFISSQAAPGPHGSEEAPDGQGRRSLVPSGQTPVYGVRRPELERAPEDYFKRGGRRRE